MLKEHEAVVRRAMIAFDAFIVSVSFFVSFGLRRHFHEFYKLNLIPGPRQITEDPTLSLSDYTIVLFFVVPIWCLALYFSGAYSRWRTRSASEIFFMIVRSAAVAAISFGTAAFVFKLKFVSRAFFVIFMATSSALVIAEKLAIFFAMRNARRQGHNYRRLLIVGAGNRAAQFIRKINEHKEWGFKIVGAVDYEEIHRGREIDDTGATVLGMLEDIPRLLKTYSVDEVIFLVPRSKLNLIEDSLYICETLGVRTSLAADLFELRIAKAYQTEIEGTPLITFETTVAQEWQRFVKRAIDITASGLGLILLSPLFLAVAAAIKLTSPGPVFFIQKRVSLNNRKFVLYKFRSMYRGSHLRRDELAGRNIMAGPVFKVKDDPRVTPVGRVLRKFSIDELPQLFNVLAGHMSLVGPRPPLPSEVARYEPWQRRRLSMRPGLTCLWQVSGRNAIGFEEWMKLDIKYIDNWSLWLDFKIIAKTVPVVLFGKGAY
jgi:exopolysaccharide biosynthesis polyprenyl glycosylphosphotransferase